jgi:hypothetical protein
MHAILNWFRLSAMHRRTARITFFLFALSWLLVGRLPHLFAQTPNGITSPASGDTVSGIVIIRGTATDNSFLRYELAFRSSVEWIVMADGDTPVVDGTLAIWDTTVAGGQGRIFPDGSYELRLRVVRLDYNYAEYFVSNIRVANEGAVETPTPTASPEGAEDAPAARTPIPTLPGGEETDAPAVLPSLTPFPTPSRPATPVADSPGDAGVQPPDAEAGENAGVLEQLRQVDLGQFGQAFWVGVRFTFLLFAALGLYLILRGAVRWLWRKVRGRITI